MLSRLELEKMRIAGELRLQEAEIDLKRQEFEARNKESQNNKATKSIGSSPLIIAIITGILSLIGAGVVSLLQSQANLNLERERFQFSRDQSEKQNAATEKLERQKFQSTLILKAIETGNPSRLLRILNS